MSVRQCYSKDSSTAPHSCPYSPPMADSASVRLERTRIAILATRTRPGIACLILVLGFVGCSDYTLPTVSPASAPSIGPAPPVTPQSVSVLADATLSGVVYEVLTESPRQIGGIE